MPELPEVETVKSVIEKELGAATILDVCIKNPHLRQPVPKDFRESVIRQRIVSYKRIAKYILCFLSNSKVIVFHLGMSGTLRLEKNKLPTQKHDHLVFETSNGYMIYNDPRRFGLCLCLDDKEIFENRLFKNLGIDPFDKNLTGAWLKKKLEKRSLAIKQALLDQALIAGIGNIYASEALFLAGILPMRSAQTLSLKECHALIKGIRKTLSEAIAAGGSTLKDYRQPDGRLGYFQNKHCVYGKTGQSCPGCTCFLEKTKGIQKTVQGGRSSYYCATKQR